MDTIKPLNIYQKIVEIRKTIDAFEKDGKGHNYKYVTGSQVLNKIKSKMDELGVVLEPHLINQTHHTHTYKTKYNEITDFVVTGDMKMIWVNADNPIDRAVVDWQMAGQQDDISKALGSGLTYSERYFILKYFGVPTDDDDPDAKGLKVNGDNQQKQQNNQETTNSSGLSDKQITRAYAIATKSKITKENIDDWILVKFKKSSIKDLTKKEYDELCTALENPPKA